MDLWQAYEDEWYYHPTVDDLAAGYLDYKPVPRPGDMVKKDESTMGPLEFMAFVRATAGSKMAPGAP